MIKFIMGVYAINGVCTASLAVYGYLKNKTTNQFELNYQNCVKLPWCEND